MFRELLRSEFQPYGALSDLQLDQLERHYELLMAWNRRLNLTRITDLVDIVRFHYCESLFVSTVLPQGPLQICDLGSGAGFPGIPLAVYRSDIDMALIEADQRKAVFLREAGRELTNVRVLASRQEDVTDRFDWTVSRAVAVGTVLAAQLAPNCALLVSTNADQSAMSRARSGGKAFKLPWGRDRILFVSHETYVSRGT